MNCSHRPRPPRCELRIAISVYKKERGFCVPRGRLAKRKQRLSLIGRKLT